MTVQELYKVSRSHIKIMSGYNGKVLCYQYSPEKHKKLSEREILSIWSEVKVITCSGGDYAKAIISVFVNGSEEYKKEREKKNVE